MAKNEPTFEEMLAQLEAIVSAVEAGKIGLEESIAEYEKGMKLIQRCRCLLNEADAKVQKLQLTADGTLKVESLDNDNRTETAEGGK